MSKNREIVKQSLIIGSVMFLLFVLLIFTQDIVNFISINIDVLCHYSEKLMFVFLAFGLINIWHYEVQTEEMINELKLDYIKSRFTSERRTQE